MACTTLLACGHRHRGVLHARIQHPAHHPRPAAAAHRPPAAQPTGPVQRHQRRHARRDPRRGGMGQRRAGNPRHRGRRGGQGLLWRLRPRRLCRAADRTPLPAGSPPLGPDGRLRRHEAQHRGLHEPVALIQADDRQSARRRGGRRQRHRDVLRPAGDGRGRAHRLHAHPRLGLPDHGHVDLPARGAARQADDVHRRRDRRPHRRRLGAGQRGRAGANSWRTQ